MPEGIGYGNEEANEMQPQRVDLLKRLLYKLGIMGGGNQAQQMQPPMPPPEPPPFEVDLTQGGYQAPTGPTPPRISDVSQLAGPPQQTPTPRQDRRRIRKRGAQGIQDLDLGL